MSDDGCANCGDPRDRSWPLGSDVCGVCWDLATACVGGSYEHDWSDVPQHGSGECPACGAELIDE